MNLALKIVTFLTLAAVIVLAARSLLKEREPETVKAKTFTVSRMDIEQSVYGSGLLRCSRRAEVASHISGKIMAKDVLVKEGQKVSASDVLCKITNQEFEGQLSYARTTYETADYRYKEDQRDYEYKKQTSVKLKTPTEKELERLKNELREKEAELKKKQQALEELEKKLEALTVKSPLTGTVLKSHLKPADMELDPDRTYPEGTPLFEVGDLTSLRAYGTILESDRSKVNQGDPAMVRCGKEGWLPANVTRLDLIPSAASEGGRYEIELDLDAPPSGLNEGLTVDFRIVVQKKSNVLAVPVEYVEVEDGRHWVNRKEGDKITRVPIDVGISSHSLYEVKQGLKEGDTIRWEAGAKE